ncbi:hypothetical protein L0F63_000552, partial [Massospora cicadina]
CDSNLLWLENGSGRDAVYGVPSEISHHRKAPWQEIDLEIEPVDYLSKFQVHLPQCELNSVERKCIEYAYDWFMYMTTHEEDRAVFEAAVLIVAGITILEEKSDAAVRCTVFGLPLNRLMKDVARVLHPRASDRLRVLVRSAIDQQGIRQRGNPELTLATLQNISTCYMDYMRWRSIDGYYEVAMLCSFAAMGESCAQMTFGVANDILEAAILAHDTHSILRHFEEDEMANCHRYLDPNLQRSIERAFKRVAALRNRLRFDPTIPHGIKRCAMVAISSCHAFNYACRRYRFGADFAAAANFVNSSTNYASPFANLPKSSQPYSKLNPPNLNHSNISKFE